MEADTKLKLEANIWKVYFIVALAGFAFFYNEIFVLYYQHFGLSFSQVSLIVMVTLLISLLLAIPAGAFADVHGRKKSLFIAALCMSVGLAIFSVSSSLYLFIVAAFFVGASFALSSGAGSALIYDSLKELERDKEYLKIVSKRETIFLAVSALSAFFGPLLFSLNVRLPYYVSAGAALIWAVSILSLYEPKPVQEEKVTLKSHYLQMKEGVVFTLKHRKIMWMTFFSGMVAIIMIVIGELVVAPYIIESGFNLKQLGLIALIVVLIQIVSTFFIERIEKKMGEKKSFFVITFLLFSTLILMYYSRNYLLALFLGLFWSTVTFKDLVVEKYINHHLHKKNRATVLSVHSMSLSLVGAVFIPIFGIIIDATSLSLTILILAILSIGVGSVLLFIRFYNKLWKEIE